MVDIVKCALHPALRATGMTGEGEFLAMPMIPTSSSTGAAGALSARQGGRSAEARGDWQLCYRLHSDVRGRLAQVRSVAQAPV